MKRNRVLAIACLLLMLAGTGAVVGNTGFGTDFLSFAFAQPTQTVVLQDPQVAYEILFRKLIKFDKEATKLEGLSQSATHLRTYSRRKYELSTTDAQKLQTIARETIQNLASNEQSAYTIINNIRNQFPNGQVPSGAALPTPPPQLGTLQTEREQIISAGRSRLQTAFGATKFYKFEAKLQEQTQAGMRSVQFQSQNSEERAE